LAWSPDGLRIVSGGDDNTLRLWNPVTGQLEKTQKTSFRIHALCWSPDGSRIASAANDNDIYIWDSLAGPPRYRLSGHTTYVHTVSWSSDGERIASADESGSVRIWDAHTGQQTLTLSYPSAVPMVAWNPDGKRLACVSFGSHGLRIWNTVVEKSDGAHW
jgi:WD40 repeat protein